MSDNSRQLLDDAQRRYRAGFRARAARLCSRIPRGDPLHAEALALLGAIRLDAGLADEASGLLADSAGLNPANAQTWARLGEVSVALGRAAHGRRCLRRASLLAPDIPDPPRGLAGRAPAAERHALLRRCLVLSPLDKVSRLGHGQELKLGGHLADAAGQFRRLLLADPGDPDGLFQLANAVRDLGDADAAATFYGRTIVVVPRSGAARNNLGQMAFDRGAVECAERWFAAATVAAPGLAASWSNHARALRTLDREAEAPGPARKGLLIEPDDAILCGEVAGYLRDARWAWRARVLDPSAHHPYDQMAKLATRNPGRKGVMAWLRRSAIITPSNPEPWFGVGVECGLGGDLEAALRHYARATQIADGHDDARMNLAFALLALGRFGEGWRAHLHRLEARQGMTSRRRFAIPAWNGEPLAGRHLLLWGEQGIGDEVQFLSLLPHILRLGARVTVLTEPRLRPIVARSFPGVTVPEAAAAGGAVEDHHGADLHLAIGDLPHRLDLFCGGSAVPEPWIVPDPARTTALRSGLQARHPGRRLVGITWRSVAPTTGGRRTIPPALWLDIARVPGVALVSLQYGVTDEDLAAFADAGIEVDVSHGVEPVQELDGLAALVAAMDLVVCPTNNTVHFAGALSMPCWVLLPTRPDWRWGLAGRGSLWYPRTRVYRQQSDDDWPPVLAEVAEDLGRWADGPA